MANLRQIRRRIRFTQNTKAVMRAMQLVAASKLKRTQDRLLQARVVSGYLDELLGRLSAEAPHHPLCEGRDPATSVGLVVITSDAGLCGAYNANLISLADAHLKSDHQAPVQLVLIGKQGFRYFSRRGYQMMSSALDLAGRPNPTVIRKLASSLIEAFLARRVDAIQVAYTRFLSSASYRPALEPWLPIQHSALSTQHSATDYIFEPSPQRVFDDLVPRFALAKFQQLVLEAFTSEHSARMIAMKNATDNATELLDELTLLRNKVRQAAITKELSEITGTAEALK